MDPTRSYPVEIAGKKRTQRWGMRAFRVASSVFKGRPVRDLVENFDVGILPDLAACGFLHEDPTITGDTIEAWLDADPAAFVPLQVATISAIGAAVGDLIPSKPGEAARAAETTPTASPRPDPTAGPTSGDS